MGMGHVMIVDSNIDRHRSRPGSIDFKVYQVTGQFGLFLTRHLTRCPDNPPLKMTAC